MHTRLHGITGLCTALLLCSVAACLAFAPTAAQAQETAEPESATADETGAAAPVTDRIIVTARRREENLQDTPVAITAFTGGTLERRQILSTADLDRVTPSL